MNILWLCPFVPYPLDNGGNIRVFSMLSHLAKIHAVTLVCLDDPLQGGRDVRPLRDLCAQVHVLDAPPFFPLKLHHAPYFFSRTPGSLAVGNPRLKRQLAAIAAGQDFDLLHVEFSTLAELALGLNIKKRTLTEHFLAIESYGHNVKEMSGFKRWYFQRELTKLERWEPAIARQYDHIFVTSEPHLRRVSEWMGGGHVTLVPNGVDVDYFQPQVVETNAHSYFFMGAFHLDASSQRALAVLVDKVFPTIQQDLPDAVLHVVGKGVPQELKDRAHANIRFYGYVDDVRPLLAFSAALLLPVVGGSGTKLRILTAMAMGKPVITSVDGLAGLDCADGEELFIARDWQDMATKAVHLSCNTKLCSDIGRAARRAMEERFSWVQLAHIQEGVWQTLAGEEHRG